MRLEQLQRKPNYLYEGLDRPATTTMLLWENAGVKLKEAALTADQISNLFSEIEKAQTAGGGNRTLLGKGKDTADAVNKAWEDLKSKIQNSGPIKGFDQKVSDVLSKIGVGSADPEMEGKVSGWVQKYRDFAKKHPIIQGALYATLIAAAGISGAGVGGAAVLGLLKMADKLLQGEKFSSAAYAGAKTGALAYGASKLGDYIKDKFGGEPPGPDGQGVSGDIDKAIAADEKLMQQFQDKYPPGEYNYLDGGGGRISIVDADGAQVARLSVNPQTMDTKTFADLANQGGGAAAADAGSSLSDQILDQSLSNVQGRHAARQAVAAALDSGSIDSGQAKELLKQIGSAVTDPNAAERAITQTLQNVGSGAAKSAAQSAGTSAADVLSSTADAQDLRAALSGAGDAAVEKGANQLSINQLTQARADAAAAAKKAAEDAVASGITRPNEVADAAARALEKAGAGTNVGGNLAVDTVERISRQAADDAIKNSGDNIAAGSEIVAKGAGKAPFGAGMDPEYLKKVVDAGPDSGVRFKISPDDAQKALDYQAANPDAGGAGAASAAADSKPASSGTTTTSTSSVDYKVVDGVKTLTSGGQEYTFAGLGETPPEGVEIVSKVKGTQGMIGIRGIKQLTLSLGSDGKYYNLGESLIKKSRSLSEGQVYLVFDRVCKTNDHMLSEGKLSEGPMDMIKGLAGKAMDKVKTVGHNLTTKVTADKLNSAWQKAGSPTDPAELQKFLTGQGVNTDVVDSVFKSLKIEIPAAQDAASPEPAAGAMGLDKVKELIMKLPIERKARLLTYLMGGKKAMTAKPAPEDDNPNIVRGTESIQRKGKKL